MGKLKKLNTVYKTTDLIQSLTQKIIHRDLKPMLSWRVEDGWALSFIRITLVHINTQEMSIGKHSDETPGFNTNL